MKIILTLALLIVILNILIFKQYSEISNMDERMLLLQHQRDSIMADIDKLEIESDSASAIIDSLTNELSVAKITSINVINDSQREINQLSAQLDLMIPKNIIGDSIRVAISGIQSNYELQMSELRKLLTKSDTIIIELKLELDRQREINASLLTTIDLTTQQRDNWEKLAKPNLFERIKRNIGVISTSIGVGLLAGGILLGG